MWANEHCGTFRAPSERSNSSGKKWEKEERNVLLCLAANYVTRTGEDNKVTDKNLSDGNHGNQRKSYFLFCLPRQKTLGAEGSEDPLSQSLSLSRLILLHLSNFSFVEGALLHTKAPIISIDNKGMCVTFVQLLLCSHCFSPYKNDKIFQEVNRLEKEKTPEATRCCAGKSPRSRN